MAISTMYSAKAGSPKTVLASQITANATSMTVADPTVLPSAPNICVLGASSNAEVVSYSAINGNIISGLVRGLGGTSAQTWPSDTVVARNITSFDHDRFKLNIETLASEKADTSSLGNLAMKDSVSYSTEVTDKPTLGSLASMSSISYTSAYLTNKPTLGGIEARPNYTISTTDPGEGSSLSNGKLYFVV